MPQDDARSPGASAPEALRRQAVQAVGSGKTRVEAAVTFGVTLQTLSNR